MADMYTKSLSALPQIEEATVARSLGSLWPREHRTISGEVYMDLAAMANNNGVLSGIIQATASCDDARTDRFGMVFMVLILIARQLEAGDDPRDDFDSDKLSAVPIVTSATASKVASEIRAADESDLRSGMVNELVRLSESNPILERYLRFCLEDGNCPEPEGLMYMVMGLISNQIKIDKRRGYKATSPTPRGILTAHDVNSRGISTEG